MAEYVESICRRCFHSYVCEQFNEHRDSNNEKCHFYNDHFVPAADVAPVVRCVNCIHYGAEASAFDAWTPFCLKHKLTTFPDDFCSYGERKGGDG